MFRLVIAALVASASAFAPNAFVARRAAPSLALFGVEEQVKDIIVSQLGVDADKVVPSATFVDDLGADSLDTVELIMAIEEEFDCEIPEEKAAEISTVQQVSYLRRRMDGSRVMRTPLPVDGSLSNRVLVSLSLQVIDYVAAL